MNRLFDKTAILILCIAAFGCSDKLTEPVAPLLTAVICSGAVQLLSGTRIAAALLLAVSAGCGIFPVLLCAFPLLLYDALWEKKWWLVLPSALAIFSNKQLSVVQLIIILSGTLAACMIYSRVSNLETTVATLTDLRDQVTEKNMQLSQQNRKLAQAQDSQIHLAELKERSRIAREIHDNVGHLLTRSILQSGAIMVINKDEQLKEPLAELKGTLDSAMTSIRASVHDLHNESLDLKHIIEDSAGSVGERFTVDIDYDMSPDVPGNIKLCMAGVVKEGLSNAVKHSNGDRIRIVLREHPSFYQLHIEDNGCCTEIKETGIGLKNMEERAASAGGTISFTPSENGFRIFMSIPKDRVIK